MDNKIKIIGRIDLSPVTEHESETVEGSSFRIQSMMVSFWGQEPALMSFDIGTKEDINDYRFFSLLIGRNGVGKSLLLREIIDFFVIAYTSKYCKRYNKPVQITAIKYVLNETEYNIKLNETEYNINKSKISLEFYRNELWVSKKEMEFPLIIASTMGMFDKFPQNNGKVKKNRYNVPIYKYIGPKAKSNIFSSKSNLMIQMLAELSCVNRRAPLEKISTILKFIGYDERILLEYKVKDTLNTTAEKKVEMLSSDGKFFFENLYKNKFSDIEIEEDIDLNRTSISRIKRMRLSEVYELRQNGLLSKCNCYLFKHGEKLQCEQLSSGEFNMLSIVMNVVLTANNKNLLILLDEPEISQHPNWQVDIIGNLDTALKGFNCHFLIATHSHFLVSNLPQDRSNVIDIEKTGDKVEIMPMECNTLGWSAEEVLLKVFKMATDRNRYLAEIVGSLLSDIAQNRISLQEAKAKVEFIKMVSCNLSNVDPMKKIILSIIAEFENHE